MSSERQRLEMLILDSLKDLPHINLTRIAIRAGLSVEVATQRRAIQRALISLIQQQKIIAQGAARARFYQLYDAPYSAALFPVSNYQAHLIGTTKMIAYQQSFLDTYCPNQTYYLDAKTREQLLTIGRVESVVRPAGTYARTIFNRLLIDLSWNSSRLEGNTYSLLETKRLIELGDSAQGKNIIETQMILNHKEAIEYIIETAEDLDISSHAIRSIHALLSDNLLGSPAASGRLRQMAVRISGTSYTPLDDPHLLQEYFNIVVKKLNEIHDPFEQSFFSLVHLSYLQAFEDVNKRTSRLVANIPLIKQNLNPLSFVEVDQEKYVKALFNVYEKNNINSLKDLYVWSYQRSVASYSALQQTISEPSAFKIKHKKIIQGIIHAVITAPVPGKLLHSEIKKMVMAHQALVSDTKMLLNMIETEIANLHDGNVARFKIRPSEFERWLVLQR